MTQFFWLNLQCSKIWVQATRNFEFGTTYKNLVADLISNPNFGNQKFWVGFSVLKNCWFQQPKIIFGCR